MLSVQDLTWSQRTTLNVWMSHNTLAKYSAAYRRLPIENSVAHLITPLELRGISIPTMLLLVSGEIIDHIVEHCELALRCLRYPDVPVTLMGPQSRTSQTFQKPLFKEYTLNHIRNPIMI